MKTLLTLLGAFATSALLAQSFKPLPVKTQIKEVTVFNAGAQIFEQSIINVPEGHAALKILNLSPYIDAKSIRAELNPDITILSVNHALNHVNELSRQSSVDSLKSKIKSIEGEITLYMTRLHVLKEKASLLNENKKIGSQQTGLTMAQLQQALEFYDTELTKIKKEENKIDEQIDRAEEHKIKLEQQIKAAHDQKYLPSGEIEIRIKSEKNTSSNLLITYLVSNAGWYPKYDIRVKNVSSPLELIYKAEVYQNTGVDWKNVKLRFSNGNPNQSGSLPILDNWNLNFARNTIIEQESFGVWSGPITSIKGVITATDNEPLIGATVVIDGSNIGSVTDADGRYQLVLPKDAKYITVGYVGFQSQVLPINQPEINVKLTESAMLNEIVVNAVAAGRSKSSNYSESKQVEQDRSTQQATVRENQTTVEVEIAEPYTILSNGEKLLVDLKRHSIDAFYQHLAIPKIDQDAFLIAKIKNWDQYQLLQGEANLYYENAYIGRSVIEAGNFQDTMEISLGRDKNIQIKRDKNEQYQKNKFIGTNAISTRGFKITVRNKKSFVIHLKLMDQIPVAVISDIEVKTLELTHGLLDEKTGIVTWDLTLGPQQQKEIDLRYEVKYPKREKVILE